MGEYDKFDQIVNMMESMMISVNKSLIILKNELKDDISEVKREVAELKADVSDLKGEVADLKGEVREIKTKIKNSLEPKIDSALETTTDTSYSELEKRIIQLEKILHP